MEYVYRQGNYYGLSRDTYNNYNRRYEFLEIQKVFSNTARARKASTYHLKNPQTGIILNYNWPEEALEWADIETDIQSVDDTFLKNFLGGNE